ncbi:GNAT family N-acetyltransferase [Paenibacillus sp. NEAU-GSW1]|uniref:GNAT family N-acetyltransferase n=1 Tax=Paenibacillus sp. NEAU-GSW1 TaxID=2682486 RepID=UPI0012E1E071|nr:GNAT family N-acetyltransferase [Paenibacillus sp. NEAU-GSW1]MUT64660.1 GNAT family N-acetyltransferase [Paenibacillus sp. NEAU-GSW1]
MNTDMTITKEDAIGAYRDELSELLVEVVNDGASIGFLPPLCQADAAEYWSSAIGPDVLLFNARLDGRIVGTVQVHLSTKQNGSHRAEIAKLMTHPGYRRRGIGRALMERAEESAKQAGRSLLVLDTRDGDPSNGLYTSIGYIPAGSVPYYAQSANGELHATNFYYKVID